MALAIVLILLLIGSVIFNFSNPWTATPVASNWGSIDEIIVITVVITGIFFIAITAFVAVALIKFRHRESSNNGEHQASNKPDNKKLEWWLTGVTTVGICALLAPGLLVYDDFVHVPKEATTLEVVARQWMWSFRLPGEDGELGKSSISLLNGGNPFGVDPNDPLGQDDILIASNEIHVQLDQPVKFLLRSLDVLHNFYVPHFRAKMDMVPGQLTYFWLTPTKIGTYEVLCAEYCGLAHYNMRAHVVVDSPADYKKWLATMPTFADKLRRGLAENVADGIVEQGRQLVENNGCLACHSVDGSKSLGPGWMDLFGREETLNDGSKVIVDDEYFRESVTNPADKLVQGFPPVMVAYPLSVEQLDAIVAYVQTLVSD